MIAKGSRLRAVPRLSGGPGFNYRFVASQVMVALTSSILALSVTPPAYADDALDDVAVTATTAAIAAGVRKVPVARAVQGADTIVATTHPDSSQ